MATETSEGTAGSDVETDPGLSSYIRGITVTTCSTLAGIAAGVLSVVLAFDPGATNALFLVVAAVVVQFPVYGLVGIDTGEFGTKDYLYVFFMTFSMWFISWGILLTAGV